MEQGLRGAESTRFCEYKDFARGALSGGVRQARFDFAQQAQAADAPRIENSARGGAAGGNQSSHISCARGDGEGEPSSEVLGMFRGIRLLRIEVYEHIATSLERFADLDCMHRIRGGVVA